MRKKISKRVMLNRLARLSDVSTTRQVTDLLKLSKSVIDRWLRDKKFRSAGVAWDENGKWLWSKPHLAAWIQAVMKLSETKGYVYKYKGKGRRKRSNPPAADSIAMNPSEIAEVIGFEKHSVGRSDKKK